MAIRVLLVDDVPEVRRLVRTALRFRGGFEVVGEAADGSEAVLLADSEQPDVVVLDLGLPDIAGREVLTRIRAQAPQAKVVVFSGTESPDRDWIAQRVEAYVLKDADLDYLVDLLEDVAGPGDHASSLALPRDPGSVARARAFVRQRLQEWRLSALVDDALVVVSELVTNAITHAQSACEVRIARSRGSVRLEVLDGGAGTPDPQESDGSSEHGRGLHLIGALTAAWGVELIPDDGKRVWAELRRTG